MQQVVCTKCRCTNQFGAIFCRNCGKKLPAIDKNHPDRKLQSQAAKVLKRLFKLLAVLASLVVIAAIILPIGYPAPAALTKDEQAAADKNYVLLEKRIASGAGTNDYVFSAPELAYVATKLLAPPPPKSQDKDKKGKASQEPAAEPAAPTTPPPEIEQPPTIQCTIKDDVVTIIAIKKLYSFTQLRLALSCKFSLKEPEPAAAKPAKAGRKSKTPPPQPKLEYTITGAKIGHIPVVKLFSPHILEMFKMIVFNRKIERMAASIKNITVKDGQVIVIFKQQIK